MSSYNYRSNQRIQTIIGHMVVATHQEIIAEWVNILIRRDSLRQLSL